jgi:hypothetical protein
MTETIICYGCDGTGNDSTYTDQTCNLCKGKRKLEGDIIICVLCGHRKSSHNGDYSYTGNATECSEEISDSGDGTTCGCVPTNESFVTASQRAGEINQRKQDRRQKLIKENKATPDI